MQNNTKPSKPVVYARNERHAEVLRKQLGRKALVKVDPDIFHYYEAQKGRIE